MASEVLVMYFFYFGEKIRAENTEKLQPTNRVECSSNPIFNLNNQANNNSR